MKRFYSFIACLACLSPMMGQTDYTDLITNPSFEQDGMNGWTNNGYWTQTNESPSGQGWTKDGATYTERWSETALNDGGFHQTVNGLPDGYYLLTAQAHASQGSSSANINGAYLFAGRKNSPISKGGTYQVGAIASGGKLTIGLYNQNTNATWIAADNFRICSVDTTLNAYRLYLRIVQQDAKDLSNEIRRKNYYLPENLTAAINHATQIEKTKENIVACVGELEAAMEDYTRVRVYYDQLGSLLTSARNNASRTDYTGKDALMQTIKQATDILSGEANTNKVKAATTTLRQALDTYLSHRPSEWVTIQNGQLWKSTAGQTVQAHAPGFVRVGDLWYMVGEDRSNSWNPDVNLYSSTDLVTWKFEKKVIQNGVTDSRLGSSRMIERAKLMYNEKTAKYIIWCHWESSNYGASEAACFSCDSVNGAYQLEWCGRPLGIKSRDCNIFVDNDGTAYFISTTEENQHLGLFRLSEDYLQATDHVQLFAWQRREAPAIVRLGERYFMFSSACSGWDPNQCKLSYSNSLSSGWSNLTNVGNAISYDTQAAAILEIKGTKTTTYLYVGDRWQDPDLPNTKTIMFPISFNGTQCDFKYHERFDINFATGEWRETPTEHIFANKAAWKVIDKSSEETSSENGRAQNVIDGDIYTKWHTQYSGNKAEAPHFITIDMGEAIHIKGFLATPRMDGSTNGLIRKYRFQTSQDNQTWKDVSTGSWLPYCTEVNFPTTPCRYIKFICEEGEFASLAELDVVTASPATDITSVYSLTHGEVDSVTYYSLDGMRLNQHPQKGLYIQRTTYKDGSTHNVKRGIF
ncbi:MAG: discoidin domain-containing protein [Paraprevotella sp.]|nr:discoidin domain-containing protein [Paraprevotella sp.]